MSEVSVRYGVNGETWDDVIRSVSKISVDAYNSRLILHCKDKEITYNWDSVLRVMTTYDNASTKTEVQ